MQVPSPAIGASRNADLGRGDSTCEAPASQPSFGTYANHDFLVQERVRCARHHPEIDDTMVLRGCSSPKSLRPRGSSWLQCWQNHGIDTLSSTPRLLLDFMQQAVNTALVG